MKCPLAIASNPTSMVGFHALGHRFVRLEPFSRNHRGKTGGVCWGVHPLLHFGHSGSSAMQSALHERSSPFPWRRAGKNASINRVWTPVHIRRSGTHSVKSSVFLSTHIRALCRSQWYHALLDHDFFCPGNCSRLESVHRSLFDP